MWALTCNVWRFWRRPIVARKAHQTSYRLGSVESLEERGLLSNSPLLLTAVVDLTHAVTAILPAVHLKTAISPGNSQQLSASLGQFLTAVLNFDLDHSGTGNSTSALQLWLNTNSGAALTSPAIGENTTVQLPGVSVKTDVDGSQETTDVDGSQETAKALASTATAAGSSASVSASGTSVVKSAPGAVATGSAASQPSSTSDALGTFVLPSNNPDVFLGPNWFTAPVFNQVGQVNPARPDAGIAATQGLERPGMNLAMPAVNPGLVSGTAEAPLNQGEALSAGIESVRDGESVAPVRSDLLRQLMPLEVEMPSETLSASLDPFAALGGDLGVLLRGMGISPWIYAMGVGAVALELARRCQQRAMEEMTVAAGCEGVTFSWVPDPIEPTSREQP